MKEMSIFRSIQHELKESNQIKMLKFTPEEKKENMELERLTKKMQDQLDLMDMNPDKDIAEKQHAKKKYMEERFPQHNWDEFYFGIK